QEPSSDQGFQRVPTGDAGRGREGRARERVDQESPDEDAWPDTETEHEHRSERDARRRPYRRDLFGHTRHRQAEPTGGGLQGAEPKRDRWQASPGRSRQPITT